MPMTQILREYDRPIINVEHTEYALRLIALREIDDARTHGRATSKAIVQYRGRLRKESEKAASGGKPFIFLDAAHARSIQGPATMDGIGPTRGWETFWMEVDVKRRRSAPWAAPVPAEIADKVRHLKAV